MLLSDALVFGQPAEKEIPVFTGRIIDSVQGKPVPYAHIYNESRRKGYVANSNGAFSIHASAGDTLVFMSIGYLGKAYKVKQSDFSRAFVIKVLQQPFEIKAVRIPLPATYEEFKKEFMVVDVKKNRPMPELPEFNPYKTPELLDTNVYESLSYLLTSPVTAIYNRYSREEESKRKVWYLKQQELKQLSVDKKYNRELITEITGFTGDDLINFMGYCNFSFNFLNEATPYEIVEIIDLRYKNYLTCCYQKNNVGSLGK